MQEFFEPSIDYLRLSITDRCNLRCRYCPPGDVSSPVEEVPLLSYGELLRVAQAAVELGVREIEVTGGEPLLRPGAVDFIVDVCQLPERPQVSLTTNGLLLADIAADLVGAGLSRVNIGLDTLRTDRYRELTRRDGLEQVRRGLEAADQAGLTDLQVRMVPIRGVNDDEIVDFARLTLHHPWSVFFVEFMPFDQPVTGGVERRLSVARIMEELSRVGMLLPVPREGDACPARLYRFADGIGRIGIMSAFFGHVGQELHGLQLSATGQLRPCHPGGHELDLRHFLRTGGADPDLCQMLLAAGKHQATRRTPGQGYWSKSCRPVSGVDGLPGSALTPERNGSE